MSYRDPTGPHAGDNAPTRPDGSQSDDQPGMFEQVTDESGHVTLTPVLPVEPARDQDAEDTAERFEEYHRLNPAVYRALCDLARRFKAATGRERLSVQRCIEIARWDLEIASKGEEEYRINNNFGAYYARLVMLQEPDLLGVFEIRRSHEADNWIATVARRRGLRGNA